MTRWDSNTKDDRYDVQDEDDRELFHKAATMGEPAASKGIQVGVHTPDFIRKLASDIHTTLQWRRYDGLSCLSD